MISEGNNKNWLHTTAEQTVVTKEPRHGGTLNLGDRLLLLTEKEQEEKIKQPELKHRSRKGSQTHNTRPKKGINRRLKRYSSVQGACKTSNLVTAACDQILRASTAPLYSPHHPPPTERDANVDDVDDDDWDIHLLATWNTKHSRQPIVTCVLQERLCRCRPVNDRYQLVQHQGDVQASVGTCNM